MTRTIKRRPKRRVARRLEQRQKLVNIINVVRPQRRRTRKHATLESGKVQRLGIPLGPTTSSYTATDLAAQNYERYLRFTRQAAEERAKRDDQSFKALENLRERQARITNLTQDREARLAIARHQYKAITGLADFMKKVQKNQLELMKTVTGTKNPSGKTSPGLIPGSKLRKAIGVMNDFKKKDIIGIIERITGESLPANVINQKHKSEIVDYFLDNYSEHVPEFVRLREKAEQDHGKAGATTMLQVINDELAKMSTMRTASASAARSPGSGASSSGPPPSKVTFAATSSAMSTRSKPSLGSRMKSGVTSMFSKRSSSAQPERMAKELAERKSQSFSRSPAQTRAQAKAQQQEEEEEKSQQDDDDDDDAEYESEVDPAVLQYERELAQLGLSEPDSDPEMHKRAKGHSGNGEAGLTDNEITDLVYRASKPAWKMFGGVVSESDIKSIRGLSKTKPTSLIVHKPFRKNSKDGHWVSVWIQPSTSRSCGTIIEYFDSFAKDPSLAFRKGLATLMKSNRFPGPVVLKVNGLPKQSVKTSNCGYFAVNFIKRRTDLFRKGRKHDVFAEASGFKDFMKAAKAAGSGSVELGEKKIEKFKKDFENFSV